MHAGSFRGCSLLLGASYAFLAAGCSQFVQAECETQGCDSTAGSTTDPGTTATVATSNVGTSTTTTGDGPTSDNDTTANNDTTTSDSTTTDGSTTEVTPPSSTETTAGPETDTGGVDPVCGDGNLDPNEDCDDENADETDGCLSTCVVPTSCAVILDELGNPGSGTYDIAPDGVLLTTACDMTTEGGGWTLVGKVNHANQNGVVEPEGWFGDGNNSDNLASPDLTLNASPASHGAGRFSTLITNATSLTRFELIEGGNLADSVQWFKVVETTASFEAWFSEVDPDASTVCTDVGLTDNCVAGRIQREGGNGNNATVLGGMQPATYFPDAAGFSIHIRQDNNSSSELSGVRTGTADVAEWSPGYGTQSGNGLRIWLRE